MSELLTAMGTSHVGQRVGSEASMPCDIFWTALMRSAEGSPDLRESSSADLNLEFEIMRRLFARERGQGKAYPAPLLGYYWEFMGETCKIGKKALTLRLQFLPFW